jgi:hypothetical protein
MQQLLCVIIYTRSIFSLVNITLCFWVSFCRVGVGNHIFVILFIFTCCESGCLIPSPTKKSTADITHPHTTHNHTTKNVTPGSLAAPQWQRAALRWWAAWGRRQQPRSAAAAILSKTQKKSNQNLLYQEMSTRSGSKLVLRIPINFICTLVITYTS